MMSRARLIRVAAAVAAVGLATVETGLVVRRPAQAARQDVPSSGAAKSSSPVSKPAPLVVEVGNAVETKKGGAGEIIVRAADLSGPPERREDAFMGIVAIDPETGAWRTIYKGLSSGLISPDGRYMVYSVMATTSPGPRSASGSTTLRARRKGGGSSFNGDIHSGRSTDRRS
jgi:hypothetical protein